jgi:HD-GYP domain-containing protein (c-di-GMP phosphodiesterase class II)
MNSDRCYRKRLKKAVILEELKKNAGTQFDPQIAKLMVKLIEEGKVRCDE